MCSVLEPQLPLEGVGVILTSQEVRGALTVNLLVKSPSLHLTATGFHSGQSHLQHSWKMVSGRPSVSDFVWISSHMELFSVPE